MTGFDTSMGKTGMLSLAKLETESKRSKQRAVSRDLA